MTEQAQDNVQELKLGTESARGQTAAMTPIDESPVQPVAITMPETPEQLEVFIASALSNFLQIDANATILATVVIQGLARSLTNDRERLAKDMNRLILVKAPFPGSIRAEVKGVETTTGDVLEVELKELVTEGETATWTTIVAGAYPEEKLAALRSFVMAKANTPGEVWYITTSLAVDNAAAEGAALLQAANGVQQ